MILWKRNGTDSVNTEQVLAKHGLKPHFVRLLSVLQLHLAAFAASHPSPIEKWENRTRNGLLELTFNNFNFILRSSECLRTN